MKRKFATTIFILCLFVGLCYYINLPDYRILSSMSLSSGNERDTHLKVIVYKYWGIDETIKEIETEHNGINGIPSTLEISFYHSLCLMRAGVQPFQIVKIKYT